MAGTLDVGGNAATKVGGTFTDLAGQIDSVDWSDPGASAKFQLKLKMAEAAIEGVKDALKTLGEGAQAAARG